MLFFTYLYVNNRSAPVYIKLLAVCVYLALLTLSPHVVTVQSTSTKLHLDLGDHYGLIGNVLGVPSRVRAPAAPLSWLLL